MKIKTMVLLAGMVLAFSLCLVSCDDPTAEVRERVTVTFNINYEGGTSPDPITFFKGTAAGTAIWPRNPTRAGWTFGGWRNGNRTYTRNTVIDEDITVTAQWTEITGLADQPSAAEIAELFTTAPQDPDPDDPRVYFPSQLSDSRKIWGTANPAITFAYLADPTPMVFCHADPPCIQHSGDTSNSWCDECRLYIYGSNDTVTFNQSGSQIQEPFQDF